MVTANTKKSCAQARRVMRGAVRFVGRNFTCTALQDLHNCDVIVAYNSFHDTEIEVYDDKSQFLGIAVYGKALEASHG